MANVFAASIVSTNLIVLSFCSFHNAVLHLILIWCLNVRCWSAQTSKYFMQSLISIFSPFMHILLVMVFDNCCLDPKMITSVLMLFIFNRFSSIQSFIELRQSWRSVTVLILLSVTGLQVILKP